MYLLANLSNVVYFTRTLIFFTHGATYIQNSNVLKIGINLIKRTADVSNDEIVNIQKWIKWLPEACCGKENFFFEIFIRFVAIPVNSFTRERTFSKRSLLLKQD